MAPPGWHQRSDHIIDSFLYALEVNAEIRHEMLRLPDWIKTNRWNLARGLVCAGNLFDREISLLDAKWNGT